MCQPSEVFNHAFSRSQQVFDYNKIKTKGQTDKTCFFKMSNLKADKGLCDSYYFQFRVLEVRAVAFLRFTRIILNYLHCCIATSARLQKWYND